LLRQLAEQAPGTFQHSLQVANLAEEAVIQVGGSPLLVRTGALYHDIGKMENPMYFIENQAPGVNYHDKLEFFESAEIIIGHTARGVEIARKRNLPEQIIDFIVTHHGTTAVQYFYRSYLKQHPESEGDIQKFQYPGPKPVIKEAAVLMMADSVEAASRSLKEINESTLSGLVESIIGQQIAEEQFVDANITFRDINLIKEILKKKLRNVYHIRIEYPK
jgi:putative nucleotidyltransferase with HDIG domain